MHSYKDVLGEAYDTEIRYLPLAAAAGGAAAVSLGNGGVDVLEKGEGQQVSGSVHRKDIQRTLGLVGWLVQVDSWLLAEGIRREGPLLYTPSCSYLTVFAWETGTRKGIVSSSATSCLSAQVI